ncbi:hypothetical protein OVA26_12650 [Microbacterium sp. SL62]|uniref:hypothetical protein n=1 Tax=Microbacterium sp. SL62 TaxID=2995139 RepID=UPI002275D8AE|nr:hypothetical protein [Microbacterium sp. SL62]MCY1717791.1 hypothetical protein [Microbacterium sp. SL62]
MPRAVVRGALVDPPRRQPAGHPVRIGLGGPRSAEPLTDHVADRPRAVPVGLGIGRPDPAAAASATPGPSTSATPVAAAASGSDLAVTGAQVARVAGVGAVLAVAAGLVFRARARRRTAAQD